MRYFALPECWKLLLTILHHHQHHQHFLTACCRSTVSMSGGVMYAMDSYAGDMDIKLPTVMYTMDVISSAHTNAPSHSVSRRETHVTTTHHHHHHPILTRADHVIAPSHVVRAGEPTGRAA